MNFDLAFFRANNGKGTAVTINNREASAENEAAVFMNMFPEKPEGNKFDSDAGIRVKLGQTDLGEMLAVLSGRKDGCGQLKDNKWSGLYHQAENYFTIINLARNESGVCYLGVYRKNKEERTGKFNIALSIGDETLLAEFIRASIRESFIRQLRRSSGSVGSTSEPPQETIPQPASQPEQQPAQKRKYTKKTDPSPSSMQEPGTQVEDIPF